MVLFPQCWQREFGWGITFVAMQIVAQLLISLPGHATSRRSMDQRQT